MNKRIVSSTQVPPTAFFFFLWQRTGALVLAWLRWCLGYKREGTCVHHLYKTHREGCWVLGGVMLTWVFATFKTHPEDFLCPALACYHAHFKDSIFSSLPIYATFFFNFLSGSLHIFSLGQRSPLGKSMWPLLSPSSFVLFLLLLSTESVLSLHFGELVYPCPVWFPPLEAAAICHSVKLAAQSLGAWCRVSA